MFSTIETIAIITIIIVQIIIAIRAYRKILQMKSFLTKGRDSLKLREYEVPSDKILELEPSQVVDKIIYLVQERTQEGNPTKRYRDEKGSFSSKPMTYSPISENLDTEDWLMTLNDE